MMRPYSFLFALGLSCSLFSASASAQTNQAERAAAYQHGRDAMAAGDWRGAQKIFSDLWTKNHTYDVALNLGQVELNLEMYRDAAEHLSYGLRYLPAKEKPELEGKASRGLKFARQRVGALQISVETGATVLVDGTEVGTAPLDGDVFVTPGEHFLTARVPNRSPAQETVTAKAGETLSVALVFSGPALVASSPASAPTPEAPPVASGLESPQNPNPPPLPASTDSSVEPRTIALWSGVGVTVVASGIGTVFALKASSASADAKNARDQLAQQSGSNACVSGNSACAAVEGAFNKRNDNNRAANVSFVVAGVAAAGTVAMYFLWPRSQSKQDSFHFVPAVAPGAASLNLLGSF